VPAGFEIFYHHYHLRFSHCQIFISRSKKIFFRLQKRSVLIIVMNVDYVKKRLIKLYRHWRAHEFKRREFIHLSSKCICSWPQKST